MESIKKPNNFNQIIVKNIDSYSKVILVLYKNKLISYDEYIALRNSINFKFNEIDIKPKMRSK